MEGLKERGREGCTYYHRRRVRPRLFILLEMALSDPASALGIVATLGGGRGGLRGWSI